MSGQSTGERVPGKKYPQVVEAAAVGDPTNRIARNLKPSWPTVRAIIQRESRDIAERKQELLDQSLRIARRAANRIEDTIDEANLSQANFVYGTATDKTGQLSGDPSLIIRHEHAHLHAHQHRFQTITADNFEQLLAQLPEGDESQSSDSTSLDLSLLPDEQQQGTTQEAQSNATVAVPAQEQELAQDSSGMHSHSQPDSSKKAAAFAARLRADEKKN